MKRDSSQGRERGEEAVWWERIERWRQKKRLELGVGKGTGGGWRKVELCRGPDKKKG